MKDFYLIINNNGDSIHPNDILGVEFTRKKVQKWLDGGYIVYHLPGKKVVDVFEIGQIKP